LTAVAPWLTGALFLAATLLLLVHGYRMLGWATKEPAGPLRASAEGQWQAPLLLAQRYPGAFVGYTLLFLMLFLTTNKVFSPQYLLWLLPLAALMPLRDRRQRFFWGFLAVCLLTTLLVPFLFAIDLLNPTPGLAVAFWTFNPPTVRIAVVLAFRNALLLGLLLSTARVISHKLDSPANGAE
jgi:hypothetical protein